MMVVNIGAILFAAGATYSSVTQLRTDLQEVKSSIKTFVTQEQFKLLERRVEMVENHVNRKGE